MDQSLTEQARIPAWSNAHGPPPTASSVFPRPLSPTRVLLGDLVALNAAIRAARADILEAAGSAAPNSELSHLITQERSLVRQLSHRRTILRAFNRIR